MASNAAGLAAIDQMIAACRAMPDLATAAAPAIKDAVLASLRADLAAGRSPADGKPWAPRVKDGGRAYAAAASKLTGTAVGSTLVFSLSAPEVFGHFGAQGHERREMLPRGQLPFKLGDAIRKGAVPPFRKAVKGKR